MTFARQLLQLGPRAVVITLAERGAVGAERRPEGSGSTSFEAYHLPAEPPEELLDTVGCGDVFLAALAVGWACWGRLEPALALAVRAAGRHCGYIGLDEIETLSEAWHGRASLATPP
jgi:sugar/nucleoside kinase (ribokinase family)